jgi:dimethylhistidine N-methyltransferase
MQNYRAVSRQEDGERLRLLDHKPSHDDDSEQLQLGLETPPRHISPKFFYDAHGAELFTAITRQPEYYPTRTEKAILRDNLPAIADVIGRGATIVEPGSGSSEKSRLLLDALRPDCYVPIDISATMLWDTAHQLADEFPWLDVLAICADFNAAADWQHELPASRRVGFYPGSTIGNLEPAQARQFLRRMAAILGAGGGLLIGVDRHKDDDVLNAAYNDAAGVTAAFNRNVLVHANRVLDADFDPTAFDHRARYNAPELRIEMHLVSRLDQVVTHRGGEWRLHAGETIHTENSYKYTTEGFAALAADAGFTLRSHWEDPAELFSVYYLERPANS